LSSYIPCTRSHRFNLPWVGNAAVKIADWADSNPEAGHAPHVFATSQFGGSPLDSRRSPAPCIGANSRPMSPLRRVFPNRASSSQGREGEARPPVVRDQRHQEKRRRIFVSVQDPARSPRPSVGAVYSSASLSGFGLGLGAYQITRIVAVAKADEVALLYPRPLSAVPDPPALRSIADKLPGPCKCASNVES